MDKINRLFIAPLYKATLILFMLIKLCPAFCQGSFQLDSLVNVLEASQQDTHRVNTLIKICNVLVFTENYELNAKYATDATVLSQKLNFARGIARSNNILGAIQRHLGKYEEAIRSHKLALEVSEHNHYYKGEASALHNLGMVYYFQGDLSKALGYFLTSNALYLKLNDKSGSGQTYNMIGTMYLHMLDYPEALKYYLLVLDISKEMGDKRGISTALGNIGSYYGKLRNYKEAKNYFEASLLLDEEIGNQLGVAEINFNLGLINEKLGNHVEALKRYDRAIEGFTKFEDHHNISLAYQNIALVHVRQGNYVEAIKFQYEAIGIAEKVGDKRISAYGYLEIGTINKIQGKLEEALIYFNKSLLISEELQNKDGMASAYNNIGAVHLDLGNFKEAKKCFENTVSIKSALGDTLNLGTTYYNLGIVAAQEGDSVGALNNFLSAISIYGKINDIQGIAESYNGIGNLKITTGNFYEAKRYFEKALSISLQNNYTLEISYTYKGLAEAEQALRNYEQALNYYQKYTLYKDSVFNESNSNLITELHAKYQTERKDKEILTLETDKEISRLQLNAHRETLSRIESEKSKIQIENLFNLQHVDLLENEKKLQQLEIEKKEIEYVIQKTETASKQDQLVILNKEGEIQKLAIKKQTQLKNFSLAGLGLFLFLSFFAYNNHITRQKLKLQTLRNKIASDLHDDVGSTLSSISIFTQMAQHQGRDVMPLLNTIGESSRTMLDAMADIVWTINPENDQFEKIILRMRNFAYELLGARQIDFEFKSDEEITKIKLPMEVRKNLYLIFKEATNNLVKYADANKASFSLRSEKDKLTMLIRDNGKGFDINQLTEGNGIKNMKKRAQEIGATLLIDSEPGIGTTIQLKIAV